MKPLLREGAVAFVRGTLVRLFASVWFAPGAKAVAAVGGVLVLAAIGGGSAHAISTSPASSPASSPAISPATSPATSLAPSAASPAASLSPLASETPAADRSPSTPPAPSPILSTATGTTPDAVPRTAAPPARATADDPVILNAATTDDLRRLPGIGPKRAEAILTLRSKLGRFHSVEDLLRVKGIGRATLRRLRPLVRVDAPALAARSP